MASSCTRLFRLDIRKISYLRVWSEKVLEWAAQVDGGVTYPGSVQGMFRRCVEGHGLVRTIGDWWTVGLGDLLGPFQHW